ncbi:checkpoint serine/threonine-protein kinase bub1-like protein, partial [Trifolium pratense]
RGQAMVSVIKFISILTVAYSFVTIYLANATLQVNFDFCCLCLVSYFNKPNFFTITILTLQFSLIFYFDKPWKFQVDVYGLCGVVNTMLHNCYMEIVKKESSDGGTMYLPKLPFKRYVPHFIVACNV